MIQSKSSDLMTLSPISTGVGLKSEHAVDIFCSEPVLDFFEIHAENYMGAGGPPHHLLHAVRQDYPLSIHGVGLSIGGAGPLDRAHLQRLQTLVDRYQPALFSEHLAWSTHQGVFLNDLLPLPYNGETLNCVIHHIDEVQEVLGRRMLLENPSTYLQFGASDIEETEFLATVASRTGCGLLLDVNNVYVAAINHGFDASAYIDCFPIEHVGEIHLAGFFVDNDAHGRSLLIDAHDSPVNAAVWSLYQRVLQRCGPVPTLIEWDNNIPEFDVVCAEAMRARKALAAAASWHHSSIAA